MKKYSEAWKTQGCPHEKFCSVIEKRPILRISELEGILRVLTSVPIESWTHICSISTKWMSSPVLNTSWDSELLNSHSLNHTISLLGYTKAHLLVVYTLWYSRSGFNPWDCAE